MWERTGNPWEFAVMVKAWPHLNGVMFLPPASLESQGESEPSKTAPETLIYIPLHAPDMYRLLLDWATETKQISATITKLFSEVSVLYVSHHHSVFEYFLLILLPVASTVPDTCKAHVEAGGAASGLRLFRTSRAGASQGLPQCWQQQAWTDASVGETRASYELL